MIGLIAKEYDANRKKFIPCFDDFYENTTRLITSNIDVPKRVLDLGAGTGLLTYYWFKECKTTEYVLVDIAEEMLAVSQKRFAGLENRECSVEKEVEMLRQYTFSDVKCLYFYHKFSVIMAVK